MEWFEASPCRSAPGGSLSSSTQLRRHTQRRLKAHGNRGSPPTGHTALRPPRSKVCLRVASPAMHCPAGKRSAAEREPHRQRRHAGAVRIDLTEPLLKRRPVNLLCQSHQFVLHIEDLVEPGSKKVLFFGFSPLPWSGHLTVSFSCNSKTLIQPNRLIQPEPCG